MGWWWPRGGTGPPQSQPIKKNTDHCHRHVCLVAPRDAFPDYPRIYFFSIGLLHYIFFMTERASDKNKGYCLHGSGMEAKKHFQCDKYKTGHSDSCTHVLVSGASTLLTRIASRMQLTRLALWARLFTAVAAEGIDLVGGSNTPTGLIHNLR